MSSPRVELFWWEGCPSWQQARDMLRRAMLDLDLDPSSVSLHQVRSNQQAHQEQFVGSPTIRVDGHDIQPPADGEPSGLTCRVYQLRDGRISPLPDPLDIREALENALSGRG